jgi:hypothetical protein
MIYLLSAIIIFLIGLLYSGYKIADSSIDEHLGEIERLEDEIFELTNKYEDELAKMRADKTLASQQINIIHSIPPCGICGGTVFSDIKTPEFDVIWRTCKNCNNKTVKRG